MKLVFVSISRPGGHIGETDDGYYDEDTGTVHAHDVEWTRGEAPERDDLNNPRAYRYKIRGRINDQNDLDLEGLFAFVEETRAPGGPHVTAVFSQWSDA